MPAVPAWVFFRISPHLLRLNSYLHVYVHFFEICREPPRRLFQSWPSMILSCSICFRWLASWPQGLIGALLSVPQHLDHVRVQQTHRKQSTNNLSNFRGIHSPSLIPDNALLNPFQKHFYARSFLSRDDCVLPISNDPFTSFSSMGDTFGSRYLRERWWHILEPVFASRSHSWSAFHHEEYSNDAAQREPLWYGTTY